MDDPKHCERRDNNLHDFRKFTRTRSFTYGEPQPPVRPAQPCQPLAFLPSNGVLNRRVTSVMEEEDVHMMSPVNPVARKSMLEWDSPGDESIDGSPCARYLHNPRLEQANKRLDEPIFGSIKTRVTGSRALGTTQGKRNFNRTASYAGPS
jgi:M-phase inducer tyrosine phosphatase